jgi:hypothetical protein
MDVFAVVFVVGVVCLVIAGMIALVRPIAESRSLSIRLAVLGAVLTVGSIILERLAP